MSDADQLKPCPFCGEKAEIHEHHKGGMWSLSHRCKMMGPISLDWSSSKERHIAAWNNRQADLFSEMREALELARKRIYFLGQQFESNRHMLSNNRDFLPVIDAILAKTAQDKGGAV